MNDEIVNEQTERRVELVKELAEVNANLKILAAGTAGINARLDKVNGSISTLYGRTDENKTSLLKHVIECPVKQKVEDMHDEICTAHQEFNNQLAKFSTSLMTISERMETEKKTNLTWKETLLFPIIRYLGTGLVLLFLYHASELLKR